MLGWLEEGGKEMKEVNQVLKCYVLQSGVILEMKIYSRCFKQKKNSSCWFDGKRSGISIKVKDLSLK